MRSPWAGRFWEAFGEDPYLAGVATSETVQGIQSQDVVCSYQHASPYPFYIADVLWMSFFFIDDAIIGCHYQALHWQ